MKLSTFISNNIEPILVEWENFAKTLFKTKESKKTLRDDAKKMLLVIALDLQQEQSSSQQTAKSKGQQKRAKNLTAAAKHGIARMDEGFSINELAAEYRALRASVIKLWVNASKKINPTDVNDIIRFNEAIDQSINESIDSYSSSQEQQSRHFNTMLSSSPDLSFVIDTNGFFLYVNKAMSELYQYPAHDMIGKVINDFSQNLSPEEQDKIQSVLDTGEPCRGDKIFIDSSGREYFFEFIYTPIFDKNKKLEAIACNSRDITERKLAEKNLMLLNEELESFAYVASHDLKAPLRGITSLTAWIEEDNDNQLSEASTKNLALLRSRAKRMSNLIDGILKYAQAGRVDLSLSNVNVKALLEEAIENLTPPNTFTFRYAKNYPRFQTLKTPLYQVFSNLISNAIKYNHRKQGLIEIGVNDQGEFYEFFVSDNGPGIEEQYFEKIFQTFQTIEDAVHEDSTGIGLSIVKKIVEVNHGKVWLESEVGQGSIFRFTWPKDIKSLKR